MDKLIKIMKYIGKHLFIGTIFILRYMYNVVKKFMLWSVDKYEKFEFMKIYKVFLIINFILLFVNSNILNIVKIIIILIQFLLMIFVLYKMIVNKKKLELGIYLRHMEVWSCYLLFVILINYKYIGSISYNLSKVFQYMCYISLFLTMHYSYRIMIYKYIKHWIMYTAYFLILPLISIFIWILVGGVLSQIFEMPILMSDRVLGYMMIIFTICILNFEIYFVHKEIRDEVKLALYLTIAIFSTLSYCFFLSDYLSEIIFNLLTSYSNEGIDISKKIIKYKIEWLLKWYTLPYLIGTVFGNFTLELSSRNDEIL